MVLIIVGLVMLAAGVHYVRATALPANGVPIQGTVTAVSSRKTRLTGHSHMLYRPTVTYRAPSTGASIELPPDSGRQTRYEVGQGA